ncbi:MAG: hypothetical protein GOVbin4162_90 [Prokaryotic dsDNA virus sp.]|nr:MAG: hypothetical protein GOVbin4162_90 [Prokaryotic dsDNA virus sp.]
MINWTLLQVYKFVYKRKINKLRIKNPVWHGDKLYNKALDDCIRIMENTNEQD